MWRISSLSLSISSLNLVLPLFHCFEGSILPRMILNHKIPCPKSQQCRRSIGWIALLFISLSVPMISLSLFAAPRLKAARACGVSSKSISTWATGPLPPRNRLPLAARVCQTIAFFDWGQYYRAWQRKCRKVKVRVYVASFCLVWWDSSIRRGIVHTKE